MRKQGAIRNKILFAVLFVFLGVMDVMGATVIYPAPAGATLKTVYSVKVNGQEVSVYKGWGNPVVNTGDYSFAYFDFSGTVTVEITTSKSLANLVIRPESKGISYSVSGNKITFSLSSPCNISVEPSDRNECLLLFANPLEVNPPQQGDPGVIYYGPGFHSPGQINVYSNQTLYIAGGAVVNGWISASGSNIRICGRGIVDSINWYKYVWMGPYDTEYPILNLISGYNCAIEGVILKDSRTWSLKLEKCDGVTINNVKVIVTYADMRDGISFNNSSNVTVEDSFIRCDDDVFTTYGLPWDGFLPIENITVDRTVIWTDRSLTIRMGDIDAAPYVRNITFKNIDSIHTGMTGAPFLSIDPCQDMPIENVRFENIRVNNEGYNGQQIYIKPELGEWPPYSQPPEGRVNGVYFKNISFEGDCQIMIYGPSAEHDVKNVTFENVTRAGVLATASNVSVSGYTSNIVFLGGSSNTPPSITAHPASVTVTVGQTATFSVSASGTSPLSYQWQKNQANISGATGASYTTPVTSLSDSGSKYRCVVTNSYGSATSNEATLTVSEPGDSIRIEAEDYNTGGEGVGYHDTTSANEGGAYRSDGVDIISLPPEGYIVGWTLAGEWLKYNVDVTKSGTYTLEVRVSAEDSYGKFHIEMDGTDVTGQFTMPASGGSLVWSTLSKTGVNLTAGQHVMKVSLDANGSGNLEVANLNYFNFVYTGGGDTTPPSNIATVNDGTGADIASTVSTAQLSANWTAATDAESGISNYQYAIGTTAGGTNTLGWTTIGNVLTVTKTGLTLSVGTTYYFSVKATNGSSLTGSATNSNGQVVLPRAQELVGYWKLDETSGASAADSSGKGNTGTLNGSPVWAPAGGKSGGSLSFDGTDDYVNYGTNGILNFSAGDGFTIAGWVKTTESYGPIISQRSSTEGGAIIDVTVGYDGGVTSAGKLMALVRQDSGASGYARITGGAVNNGAWRHFALKRNTDGSIELFLDGASQGTNSGLQSGGEITTDLRAIGLERRWAQDSYGTADQRYLNGSIDDVRIYNYALTTAEIQALASTGADTTAPGAPGTVRDGTTAGTDISSTTSRTQLSANWTASADAESGISGYSYAIGTTAGAMNITNWTALGNVLTATKTGLNLSVGTTYYFSVKATNGAGLTGSAANSNGQVVISTATADTTPPGAPASVKDGATAGTDAGFTYSTTTLSANWTAAADAESGISGYQYAIGTSQGATNITNGWISNNTNTAVTKTGLTLTVGATYYFSVKATNGAGLTGAATNSNGQYVNAVNTADTTPPSVIAQVRDGNETGTDASVTYLTDELSANWDASTDAESGITGYLYAIGTSPGATNITNWKDNGALTEVTETGLALAAGTTYYFSVKAENGVGLQSTPLNSSGQLVLSQDSQAPVISGVSAQSITNAGGTIIWETDELATSQVEYGPTASYGSLTGEYIVMNTAHSVTLAGLLGGTQYHYKVISRDYAGNESVSPDYVFTTLTTPAEVTEVKAYPNPCDFSNGQVIKFKAGAGGLQKGEVKIYTMTGKLVKVLSGTSEISWDGANEAGEKVARGIYLYRIIQSNGDTITGKIAVSR